MSSLIYGLRNMNELFVSTVIFFFHAQFEMNYQDYNSQPVHKYFLGMTARAIFGFKSHYCG